MGRLYFISEIDKVRYYLNMLRTARIAPPRCIYHILTRGNSGKDIFEKPKSKPKKEEKK